MQRSLADRLSRAMVGCYPPRWKQRYAAELLDVLDQHRAGPQTVLSLARGALSTHLDPDYRMQVRLIPHPSKAMPTNRAAKRTHYPRLPTARPPGSPSHKPSIPGR